MKSFVLKVHKPGDSAIIFPKCGQNQNLKPLWYKRPFVTFNFYGRNCSRYTIFEFGFFCLQELPNNWYKKQKMLQNDIFKKYDKKSNIGSFID